jgi:hypothetical protein
MGYVDPTVAYRNPTYYIKISFLADFFLHPMSGENRAMTYERIKI